VNRLPPFDSPLLLGFEHTRALIERATRTGGESYPPYNVEDLSEGGVRIVLAVAGFAAGQLEIAVEANQLTVTGRREAEEERAFLHRGIAARGFVRVFVLADGMEVGRAWLDHGLLSIEATRPKAPDGVRRIAIDSAPQPVRSGSR
jgi:HSP20 family molecular chaperone IbpA